ncbi:MAG: TetR/AcrR family transcriptional regulator [Planctomycetota bacterium]
MGRPSLAQERTQEILDAFERCISKYGLEGSSLERIAEEAGVKRSILRHYVGNRDDILEALAERVVGKYEAGFDGHLECTTHLSPVEQLVSFFFPVKAVSTAESLLVVESLIAASDTSPIIQRKMRGYVERLLERVSTLLREEFPEAPKRQCWVVAYGVVSICFNHESLTPLGFSSKHRRAAKESAISLIGTLRRETQG